MSEGNHLSRRTARKEISLSSLDSLCHEVFMSSDAPDPPDGQDNAPENVVPFSAAGEISDASLRRFNELMDGFPGDDASEEEVEAFMKEVMDSDAGAQMIESFSEQLKEGGVLDALLDEDEGVDELKYEPLESPARLIFKVELCGSEPLLWRRLSLPGDASFFDLHLAIQDSIGWEDRHLHQFEFRSQGKVEATFSSIPAEEDRENDFCGVGNRIVDVILGSEPKFHYVYDFGDYWEHLVTFENLVGAGQEGTSLGLTPMVHDGAGLCPPEDCGGIRGFAELLSGTSEFIDQFPAEFLQKLREGEFHPPAVRFRDPAEVLRTSRLIE